MLDITWIHLYSESNPVASKPESVQVHSQLQSESKYTQLWLNLFLIIFNNATRCVRVGA